MFDCKNLEICKHYFIKNPSYFMKNQPRRITDMSKLQKIKWKNKSPGILRVDQENESNYGFVISIPINLKL